MDAAIAALLGAFIGAVRSVGGMIIQQRQQSRCELLKAATELAREDWKNRFAILSRGGRMPPVLAFVNYHYKVLLLLAEGTFSEQAILELSREQERIIAAYENANDEIRQSLQSKL